MALKKFINVLLEKLGNIFNPTTSKPKVGWKSILNYQFHIYSDKLIEFILPLDQKDIKNNYVSRSGYVDLNRNNLNG